MRYDQLDILRRYKTNQNNIVDEFYMPVLADCVLYKRAVGFFSSSALIDLSRGISKLIQNGGKIKFIVSPFLSDKDIKEIESGYNAREVIERSLDRALEEPKSENERERLSWFANLIAMGRLEIKVAFTLGAKATGMYHEKIGLFYDSNGERIAFTGSLNETNNAFYNNFESIVVFNSVVEEDRQRVKDIEYDFDSLWAGREANVQVIDFPKVLKDKLVSYKRDEMNLALDQWEIEEHIEVQQLLPNTPSVPRNVKLHQYQVDAIDSWVEHNYQGIFDMATGTGKTFTGLGAVARLYQEKKRVAVIIVCPYQHLVEQWVDDIELFNMKPTIGYSASKQKDWKKRLSTDIFDFKLKVIDTFCFVTTNATFSSKFVQSQLKNLGEDTLLLIDEAHNFGATHLSSTLDEAIEYRLALSATLERHGDEAGTQTLYNYFGEKCIEYGLKRAIEEDKLTPYYYHPRVVYLTDIELEKYRELSKKISRQCHVDCDGLMSITELGKKLLIERARVVAGAANKVELLKLLMEQYRNDTHILIYCGAARNLDFSKDQSEQDVDGERQIVSVSKMLGLELGMKVTHFTSAESSQERESIKRKFAEANPYQAIVAIKCLDEGVNIPSIKTAFILASSTNPKEYVQRRGRVLRKSYNKPFATIYDFITLPTPLDYVSSDSENAKLDLALIKKEIFRMLEFGEIAKNPSEADKLIKELMDVYNIEISNEEELTYE